MRTRTLIALLALLAASAFAAGYHQREQALPPSVLIAIQLAQSTDTDLRRYLLPANQATCMRQILHNNSAYALKSLATLGLWSAPAILEIPYLLGAVAAIAPGVAIQIAPHGICELLAYASIPVAWVLLSIDIFNGISRRGLVQFILIAMLAFICIFAGAKLECHW